VSSSTTIRTRRIARPARRILCGRSQTPESPRLFTGMRFPTARRPTLLCSQCRKRFLEIGDPHEGIDAAPGSLEKLLELAAQDEAAGLGDAPWPPHFRKSESEPRRVAPSRAKSVAKKPRTKMPLIVVANSPSKEAALAGLERWKRKHPAVAKILAADDVLIDSMRGRSSTWTRIRINLRPRARRVTASERNSRS